MILRSFVIKSNNFITYFISPSNQQVKLADVDLSTKIDFPLPSQMSQLLLTADKMPSQMKIKRKPYNCTTTELEKGMKK